MGRKRRFKGTDWHVYAPAPRAIRAPRPYPGPLRAAIEWPSTLSRLQVGPDGRLVIDRRPLADLVTTAGAGEFLWLPRALAVAPSRYLLGEPTTDPEWGEDWETWGFEAGSVALGGCQCGDVGCALLMVVIEQGNGLIRWRHFATRRFDDLDIGPFTFDERQYRRALGFDD